MTTPVDISAMMGALPESQRASAQSMAANFAPMMPRLIASMAATGAQFCCEKCTSPDDVVTVLSGQKKMNRHVLSWSVAPSLSEGCYYLFVEYLKV